MRCVFVGGCLSNHPSNQTTELSITVCIWSESESEYDNFLSLSSIRKHIIFKWWHSTHIHTNVRRNLRIRCWFTYIYGTTTANEEMPTENSCNSHSTLSNYVKWNINFAVWNIVIGRGAYASAYFVFVSVFALLLSFLLGKLNWILQIWSELLLWFGFKVFS